MAKATRMPARAPASVREGTGKSADGDRELGKAYSSLMQGWTSFYRDMGSRLTDNYAKQQKAYENLFGKWNAFADAARQIVDDSAQDESQRELYDIWRNYVNKIGTRMTRASTEGLRGYGDVSANLERYATRIAEMTRDVSAGKFEASRAEEIYDTWLEVVSRLRQQMEHAAGLTRDELEDLSKTWMEFSGKLEDVVTEQLEKDGPNAKLVDTWAKQSKEVGEALITFVRGQDHDNEEARKAWTEHFLKMQDNMVELSHAIGVSYENMYRRLLEGGVTAISDLPMFPRWWTETQAEMSRRLDQLERKGKKGETPS